LWEKVQQVLADRNAGRVRKARHNFAFSRLIKCGHCGCALVGECKFGRYVYYHCSGYKGKCPEPYVREEVLEQQFAAMLGRLHFDQEVLNWVTEALRHSHDDEKSFHDQALARLQADYGRLQNRLDAMYVDKLDGQVDEAFYDRKAAEWLAEQTRLLRLIEEHQTANHSYLADGVRLLDLARRAGELFRSQPAISKRRLLNFLLSKSVWVGGELRAEFRQPFDLIAVTAEADRHEMAAGGSPSGRFENWLPARNTKKRPDSERCTAVLRRLALCLPTDLGSSTAVRWHSGKYAGRFTIHDYNTFNARQLRHWVAYVRCPSSEPQSNPFTNTASNTDGGLTASCPSAKTALAVDAPLLVTASAGALEVLCVAGGGTAAGNDASVAWGGQIHLGPHDQPKGAFMASSSWGCWGLIAW
jgi:hypothetical protein